MWKLVFREITTRKSRFFAAIAAVSLGVAFLCATLGVKNLLLGAVTAASTSTLNGDLYAVGTLEKNASPLDFHARAPIDSNLAPIIEAVDGVSHAVPLFEGEAVLLDRNGRPVSIGLSPTIVRGSFPYPPGPTLQRGRLPSGEDEVMLETTTAARAGLKVGGTAKLIWGGRTHEMRVVGVAGFNGPLGTATLAFVDAKPAKTWFSPQSRVKMIGINVGAASDPLLVRDRVQEAVGPDAQIQLGSSLRAEQAAAVEKAVGFVNSLVLWFVALSLLAGGFLIANTFGILVASRYRSFGLLRAVGYAPRTLRGLVLFQAALVGLLGSLLGVGLGIGATALARLGLSAQGWVFPTGMPMDWLSLLLAFGAGLLTTLLAAIFPAAKAGRISPLAALNTSPDGETSPSRWRAGIGVFLALASLAGLVKVLLFPSPSSVNTVFLVCVSVGFLLAVLLCLPLIQRPGWVLASRLLGGLNALPGQLAAQSLARYPKRTALGASALVVGVAIATTGGILADSARVSLSRGTVAEVQSDLVVAALQPSSNVEEALRTVKDVSGVRGANADIITAPVQARRGSDSSSQQVNAVGISAVDATETVSLQPQSGKVDSLADGLALVNSREAARWGWKVGDSISLSGPAGVYSTKIGALVHSSLLDATVFLDPQYLRQTAAPEQVTRNYIFVTIQRDGDASPSQPPAVGAVQERIQQALQKFTIFQVLTPTELASTISKTTTQVLWLMYALLGLSVLIALLGIMNTLALAVLERRRTYSLLRIIGMKPREVTAMVRWEAFLLAVMGNLVGWLLGLGLGAAWQYFLRDFGLTTFAVPWPGQLLLMFVAVVLALVAANIPARQTVRTPALMSTLAS